ncbi:MAG TPA: hypothetical protein VHP33_06270 [Polyangiaceae bacterium]|nr:hypothetical protein [Polyangiaceae bacterium]
MRPSEVARQLGVGEYGTLLSDLLLELGQRRVINRARLDRAFALEHGEHVGQVHFQMLGGLSALTGGLAFVQRFVDVCGLDRGHIERRESGQRECAQPRDLCLRALHAVFHALDVPAACSFGDGFRARARVFVRHLARFEVGNQSLHTPLGERSRIGAEKVDRLDPHAFHYLRDARAPAALLVDESAG